MNIMVLAIITLGVFAVVHFVYEAIIVPSLRQGQRFRLFALRDRLRTFKSEFASIDNGAFHALDDSLSWQLDNQHRLTTYMMAKVDLAYQSDPSFRTHVEQRIKTLELCQLDEFVSIRRDATREFLRTALINSGFWVLFIVPIAVVWVYINSLLRNTGRLVALPRRELEHYVPPAC